MLLYNDAPRPKGRGVSGLNILRMKRKTKIIISLTSFLLMAGTYEYLVYLWSQNEQGAIIRVDIFMIYPVIIGLSALIYYLLGKGNLKKVLYAVLGVILLIMLAGVIKFNFINDDVYVSDSNGEYVNDYGKKVEFVEDDAETMQIEEKQPDELENGEIDNEDEEIEGFIFPDDYIEIIIGGKKLYRFESEAEFAEDCTEQEKFDAKKSICYFVCGDKQSCEAIQDKIDESFMDEYGDFSKNFKEFEGDLSGTEKEAQAIYKIEPGEKFKLVSGAENKNFGKIKKWLADISSDDFSDKYLSRLLLVKNMDDDSAAFVAPNINNTSKWDVFVNLESLEDDGEKEMVFTLVHEFAHILTLNKTQVDGEIFEEKKCANYYIDEGCLHEDAYLNQFYQKFWKGKFNPKAEDSLENYDKQPTAFVTEYAATNPSEDIAESFATFVFKKDAPTAQKTPADQKISFFYQYPELTKMREIIRQVLKPFARKRIVR